MANVQHIGKPEILRIRELLNIYKNFTPHVPDDASDLEIHKFRVKYMREMKHILVGYTERNQCAVHDYKRQRTRLTISAGIMRLMHIIDDEIISAIRHYERGNCQFCWTCVKNLINSNSQENEVRSMFSTRCPSDSEPHIENFVIPTRAYNFYTGSIVNVYEDEEDTTDCGDASLSYKSVSLMSIGGFSQ